jgi:hypothetical protein
MDIGAFEYIPKPIAVWLPWGGPDTIRAGDPLTVAWDMDVPTAGTTLTLELFGGALPAAGLGSMADPSGSGRGEVRLPGWLPSRGDYSIHGLSVVNPALAGATPAFTILAVPSLNAAPPAAWTGYR